MTRFGADAVVVLHFVFVGFVVFGGLITLRWPRAAWLHVPAVIWGVVVEAAGWTCPLTPLENWLRRASGGRAYAGDFVERYMLPALYPAGLTRSWQYGLAAMALAINVVVYWMVFRRARRNV